MAILHLPSSIPGAPFTLLQAQLLSPPHSPLAFGHRVKLDTRRGPGTAGDHGFIHHSCGSSARIPDSYPWGRGHPAAFDTHGHPAACPDEGQRPPCPHLLPKPHASTEIPNSKPRLGIQQLISIIIIFLALLSNRGSLPPPAGPPAIQGERMPPPRFPFTRGTMKCAIGWSGRWGGQKYNRIAKEIRAVEGGPGEEEGELRRLTWRCASPFHCQQDHCTPASFLLPHVPIAG